MHVWNKAAQEDYSSTQLYCIAALPTGLLRKAVCNSLADEVVSWVCSKISCYIDLGKITSCSGEDTWACEAGPARASAQEERFTLLLSLLMWTVPYSLQQGPYPAPGFSAVTSKQPDEQHICMVLLCCWRSWNLTWRSVQQDTKPTVRNISDKGI